MNNQSKDLPNLLIPGYHKAGTTTLFTELSKHPDIFPSVVKEPFYFRPYINGKELARIEDYKRNFTAAKDEIYRMEGSPTYIYGGARAAQIIHDTLGDVKIVISIRNPVNQLFSLYKHKLRFVEIDENESFLTFAKNRDDFYRQYYDVHLQDWFHVFGDNIKCIFFESLIQDPVAVLADVVDWLGLPSLKMDDQVLLNTNPGGTYKHKLTHQMALSIFHRIKSYLPHSMFLTLRNIYYSLNGKKVTHTLSDEAKSYLESQFSAHNQALFQLLNNRGYRNLPEWITRSNEAQ